MKNLGIFLVFFMTMGFSSAGYGWSYTGHVIIAQIAYGNLKPNVKIKADKLATALFNQLPAKEQDKLNQHYATASTFAKVAILPDVWRKWKLSTAYRVFNVAVPSAFGDAGFIKIQPLHYMNLDYPNEIQCRNLPNPLNVIWGIQKSEAALQKTTNSTAQAISMVFFEHFIGDINQPLHVLTNVSHSCKGDAGANEFCHKTNATGKCTKNLHSLWDNCVGYIKPHMNIESSAWRLMQRYPKNSVVNELADNNLYDWTKSEYALGNFIYSLTPNQMPSPSYYREGQAIATKQMALAGYRLSNIINRELVN